MTGPIHGSGIFAMAEGAVEIEDPSTPTVGVVKGGAVMEADMPAQVIDPNGRFSLILQDPAADWTTASTIAKTINDAEGSDGEILAVAIDPKNVVVQILQGGRPPRASFITRARHLP